MEIQIVKDTKSLNQIVDIHLKTFSGFFLTFLGKGFLKQLYLGFIKHEKSNLIIAMENKKVLGFIAYSEDMSSLYKYLIKHRILHFAWYAFIAFLKKPSILSRLLSAFSKSDEVNRNEKYIELASIGVLPEKKSKGIGKKLLNYLKNHVNFNEFSYISLETDALENEYVNEFYKNNGFILSRTYETKEKRLMNEYHCGGIS